MHSFRTAKAALDDSAEGVKGDEIRGQRGLPSVEKKRQSLKLPPGGLRKKTDDGYTIMTCIVQHIAFVVLCCVCSFACALCLFWWRVMR